MKGSVIRRFKIKTAVLILPSFGVQHNTANSRSSYIQHEQDTRMCWYIDFADGCIDDMWKSIL